MPHILAEVINGLTLNFARLTVVGCLFLRFVFYLKLVFDLHHTDLFVEMAKELLRAK